MTSKLAQCYNKGCGQKFDLQDNNRESCIHHPGAPVFHDAEKAWSCCNKRSKDFTEFLSMPGCSAGRHNPVKPELPPKCLPPPDLPNPVSNCKPAQPKTRPSFDSALVLLKPNVSASLKQLLQKNAENEGNENCISKSETGIKVGESCKRNGCNAAYEGVGSSLDLCTYHPGGPVFHEGMKYWSCCSRKTSDFTEFLAQPGCSTDCHLWKEDKSVSRRSDCRHDWHQTSTHVYVSIYAKAPNPDCTRVSVNAVRLTASITYSKSLLFELDAELVGTIDPTESSVTLAATKVEIKLKKDEVKTWANLHVERRPETSVADVECHADNNDENLADEIDAVDLSDL